MNTLRKVFIGGAAGLAVTGGAFAFTGKPEVTDQAIEACAESLKTHPNDSRSVPEACYGSTLRAFVDIGLVDSHTMPTSEDFTNRAKEIQEEDETYRVIHALASIGLGIIVGGVVFVEIKNPSNREE